MPSSQPSFPHARALSVQDEPIRASTPQATPVAAGREWLFGVAGFVAYECALHYAAHRPGAEVAALFLGVLPFLAIGFLTALRTAGRKPALLALLAACAALWLWRAPLSHHFGWTYLMQHAGVNVALGLMFGLTLRAGRTPLCAQIAAALHGELTPSHARYARRVTEAWTLFFAAMAGASTLMFVLAPVATWSNFANLGTPLLIAAMFAGEAACRRLAFPGMRHGGLLDAVHGYRAVMAARAARAVAPARTGMPR
ncbi:Acyl carrier protein [Cupriavidus oxalaticus]